MKVFEDVAVSDVSTHILFALLGIITALAVAVGVLAVALLFSIGVAVQRRRARYCREV